MPCDEINLPAILSRLLRNQLALAELAAERPHGVVSELAEALHPHRADQTRREELAASCAQNVADFHKFLARFSLKIEKRTAPPSPCG